VLVVEDEPQVRAVTVRALSAAGYRVLAAADGREGIAVAGAEPGHIDLLVCDVVMPGTSGPEVAAALEKLRPHMRVLFVSGYTHDSLALRGELPAGVMLLQKPFTPAVLLDRVRGLLDGLPLPA
jgi:DNA-binding response OmpR family regulator